MTEQTVPKSAMAIVAHPDDAEYAMAGTMAAWAQGGCRAAYVICTDGNAGSHEPGMTRERLGQIRQAEQRAACRELGIDEVVFLGYDDGQLQPTLELRRDLVREIRRFKPEVVLTGDPTRMIYSDNYINHPDHRAAAQAVVDAVAPACAMPLLWPEVGPPHRVRQVYLYGSEEPNTWIDISETVDQSPPSSSTPARWGTGTPPSRSRPGPPRRGKRRAWPTPSASGSSPWCARTRATSDLRLSKATLRARISLWGCEFRDAKAHRASSGKKLGIPVQRPAQRHQNHCRLLRVPFVLHPHK